jgi:DNA-binding winged helix-turn-helix (wHTH) protein
MSNQNKHFYEFGPFRLDPVKRRLLRDGEPVPLTPKAFDTLLALVRQSGKTIEKDELMKEVWPDAVVEENNLNQNISALRRTLGDSRDESRYIATIPGLGYRFVAEVNRVPVDEAAMPVRERRKLRLVVGGTAELEEDTPPAVAENAAPIAETAKNDSERKAGPIAETAKSDDSSERIEAVSLPAPPTGESIIATLKRHRKVVALMLALVITGAAGIAIWIYKIVEPAPTETTTNIELTSLTRTGTIGSATISPDGRHIAYSVREAARRGRLSGIDLLARRQSYKLHAVGNERRGARALSNACAWRSADEADRRNRFECDSISRRRSHGFHSILRR